MNIHSYDGFLNPNVLTNFWSFRSEVEIVAQERDALVKKLVEAEVDAKSTSQMVLKLKETVNKLNEVRFGFLAELI